MRTRGLLAVIALLLSAARASAEPAGIEFFEQHVRPILATHCQKCHGAEKQESDLRLDSSAAARKDGVYGATIVPGRPDESTLVLATSYKDDDLRMPPKGPLAPEEVAALRHWIEIGAPWPQNDLLKSADTPFNLAERKAAHWAWQPVKTTEAPAIRNADWPRGTIDRFILSRLEEQGIEPAPDADRRTLIRRAHLDLVGQLPTATEVAEFLADESPDAFAKIVDRLLASPKFGERWSRHWFDLVRYAETYGHEGDYPIPHAWQYRDYVIRALNSDVPYDQFVVEHIAGDLLSSPRLNPNDGFNESIIATGFWFMYEQTHAPTDIRQHEADRVDNQIDVMTKAFLGITVGCARCHDHKFDAVSTRDYYALAGFLKSSRQQVAYLDPHGKIATTVKRMNDLRAAGTALLRKAIPLPGDEEQARFAAYLQAAAEVDGGANANEAAAARQIDPHQLDAWATALKTIENPDPAHPLAAWAKMKVVTSRTSPARSLTTSPISTATADRIDAPHQIWLLRRGDQDSFANWFFSGSAFQPAPAQVAVWDPSSESIALALPKVLSSRELAKNLQGATCSPTFIVPGPQFHAHIRGKGQLRIVVDNYMLDDVHKLLFDGFIAKFDTGDEFDWITIKGDLGKYVGERAYLSLEDDGSDAAAIDEVVFTTGAPPAPPNKLLADWESGAIDSSGSLAAAYGRTWTEALCAFHSGELDASHTELLNWALDAGLVDTSAIAPQLHALRDQIAGLDASLPTPMRVLAIADGTGQDEHIYRRGKHQNLGDIVPRRFLEAACGPEQPTCGPGSGRLKLAQSMVDRANPLFARTAVNRIWHHLFGRGIVSTVDNLGAQGEPPTHPELLDWLADEFARHGWSQKRLIRELMLSRTYQLSSRSTEMAAEQRDPANLLWHRANVGRIEAEVIRDCVLQVSGRLNAKMFGPSVPAYLSPFIESRFQPKTSGPLDGDGRRSIYLEVRRNYLPPMMLVFDTPTPFTTVGRRNTSNVPAQALAMLNDPLVQQLAQQWAVRTLADTPDASPSQRIQRMYETALCRLPTDIELAAAESFIQRQGELRGVPADARYNDVDTWSDFAHVLFNDKEFVLRN